MRRLALRGADLVLAARHPRWRGLGRSKNTSLVVECDGRVDPERVQRALDRLLDVCPWPAARLRRPIPWGALHWAAGPRETLVRPAVRHATVKTRQELEAEVVSELNAAIDPRREPPLRLVLLDADAEHMGAAGVVVLTWFHPLMDARGGENFLRHLDRLDRHPGEPAGDASSPTLQPEPDSRPLLERCRIAGRSLAYLKSIATPPVSVAAAVKPPGRARFRHASVVAPDAVAGDRRAARDIAWRVALVGRAMAELWRRRGLPDAPFLLPISVDLRPKGDPGPTFGNHLAFHFARFRPSETDDLPALTRALRSQMADAVRAGQVAANEVAMEFLRYLPTSRILSVLPWTRDGELFSFNCADLAGWPAALAHCFGRGVVNAYHVPVVPPRPGLGVFFNRCGPRNNVVVSWIEGAVTEDDVTRILDVVRDGMGWTR